ncbi:formate dehydrogenase major subunit [Pseudonocardia ammonioxydans]|uniref:Formate dehydrogenase major subunit n=1 Tax=Pseudonocardia ammonioxydans TaxID=260086 RepID=A0A1I5FAW4_PSUAM|nr:formate dehydrogenase major subunit [Pseudonocardia ammonioxydans]
MNSDCIVIQGSNMAEAHPVGFQWVMEAKRRGATVIHVDPRFTRTSAVADLHVPIRAGTDIALLGGLIRHVIETGTYFEDYMRSYTNAPMLVGEDFRDTEDLDGVFSGYDPETGSYDVLSWQYEGAEVEASAGFRDERTMVQEHEHAEIAGSGGAPFSGTPSRDDTLQHPRCVFQVLRRHYARYTPETVEQVCGIDQDTFHRLAEALTSNSGRERTAAFCYAVGWTHHTVGVQYIRAASILQSLLGNIGRPGGGILALRGHASIQGSTDIPTLFDLLPGYIPMPHAHQDQDLDTFIEFNAGNKGFWGHMDTYLVSLLKAWFGDAATADNDFCFDHLPRLTGNHSSFPTVMAQARGEVPGYFVIGENPAVGTANSKQQRLGLANLEWLVVRDLNMIETATFWKDGPEIETGELRTEDIGTEVFFLPAANHTEKDGTFTNTQRLLQWHHKAVEPPGDCRSDLWFYYELGKRLKARLADSTDPSDRPLQDLTWDYPVEIGPTGIAEPSAEAVLREINGTDADGDALSSYLEMKADGTTSGGCWIYTGVYADEVNQSARRRPGGEQDLLALEWGWAWPMNRRVLYNRASADPEGRPWSERKKLIWWDGERWTGPDVPDFPVNLSPDHRPEREDAGAESIAGDEPFVMQSDGRAWLYAPAGLLDGPMPAHYEPQESPVPNVLYPKHRANPAREEFARPENPYNPPGDHFPYVFTTFRVTEHHTAGGMSRWTPHLNELFPEMFLEVSPELAAERGLVNNDWAHVVTTRSAVEGRVVVTERAKPLRVADGSGGTRVIHQIGVPWHWGPNGLATGDAANELLSVALDPNVHIMETKAATCDIRPGRRPRGPDLVAFLADRRRAAGLEE